LTLRIPFAILLLQACLLFSALDLLPAWSDEAFTLKTVAHPVREIIPIVQRDIHPPLYYLLARQWQRLPLPWTGLPALRALSALWALAATVLLDLFWTRIWDPGARRLALCLFALSPCWLLYGRMARSYSMQAALMLLSLGLLQRWMKRPNSWALGCGTWAAMLALLYTHYIPGIAVMAGVMLVAWRPLGPARLAALCLATAAGYAPWAISLIDAMHRWGQAGSFSSSYASTGSVLREQMLKVAYGAISLTIGESFLVGSLLVVPVILWLAWRGIRGPEFPPFLVGILAIATGVGYLGVSRWVSYPFIPARLLWLLPFLVLALALGITSIRRTAWRRGAMAVVLVSFLSSDIQYFRRENFLDPGYTSPVREIAATLNAQAQSNDLILLDSYNTDFQALQVYLKSSAPSIVLDRNSGPLPSGHTIWIVRNTRDVSPGQSTLEAERAACAGRFQEESFLEPYPQWERTAMKIAGIQPAPQFFYQLTRCTAK
jgi:uncharacterized membrane protein